MSITTDDLQKKFEDLPEDFKWVIIEAKIDEKIVEIGNIYNLNVKQLGELSYIVHLIMLGFENVIDFPKIIKNKLDLGEEIGNAIAEDINDRIFIKVREKLIALYNTKEEKREELEEDNKEEEKEEVVVEKIIEKEKKVEKKGVKEGSNFINSSAYQKLLNISSSPMKQTDYSIKNISVKENSSYKEDPYRMPIE